MRALIGTRLGSLDHFHLAEIALPEPASGQVRLAVKAVALGYVDGLMATGRYQVKPPLPFTPGGEMAGIVDAVGPGVAGIAAGDRMAAWSLGGGLAEYCVLPIGALRPIGPRLDFAKAAALLVNYATALHALRDRARLAPGESLLVLGASGGVGVAAIEIGRRLGARVVAAASNQQKRQFAREMGAHDTIDYTDPDWRQALRDANAGLPVDVVFDPVGGHAFEPAFRSLAWGGRHLVVGFAGGPIPALRANLALLKGASLVGVDLRQFSEKEPQQARANLADLFAWAEAGELRIPVDCNWSLDRADQALAAAMSGKVRGKLVVTS